MSSAVQQNSGVEAQVSVRQAPDGSCWTMAQLQELSRLLVVKFPKAAPSAAMRVSSAINNLASLDSENAILVPAISVYADTKTLAGGSGIGPLVFGGWSGSIDATTSFLEVMLICDPTEPGIETATASGVFMRPMYEIKERIANEIKIAVYNATLATHVSIRLASIPIAPAQS